MEAYENGTSDEIVKNKSEFLEKYKASEETIQHRKQESTFRAMLTAIDSFKTAKECQIFIDRINEQYKDKIDKYKYVLDAAQTKMSSFPPEEIAKAQDPAWREEMRISREMNHLTATTLLDRQLEASVGLDRQRRQMGWAEYAGQAIVNIFGESDIEKAYADYDAFREKVSRLHASQYTMTREEFGKEVEKIMGQGKYDHKLVEKIQRNHPEYLQLTSAKNTVDALNDLAEKEYSEESIREMEQAFGGIDKIKESLPNYEEHSDETKFVNLKALVRASASTAKAQLEQMLNGRNYDDVIKAHEADYEKYLKMIGVKDIEQKMQEYREDVASAAGWVKCAVTVAGTVALTVATGGAGGVLAAGLIATGTSAAVEVSNRATNDVADLSSWSDWGEIGQSAAIDGLSTALGMKVGGKILASTMGKYAKFGASVASDTAIGAAAEFAQTGQVTVEGALMNAAMAGAGNGLAVYVEGKGTRKYTPNKDLPVYKPPIDGQIAVVNTNKASDAIKILENSNIKNSTGTLSVLNPQNTKELTNNQVLILNMVVNLKDKSRISMELVDKLLANGDPRFADACLSRNLDFVNLPPEKHATLVELHTAVDKQGYPKYGQLSTEDILAYDPKKAKLFDKIYFFTNKFGNRVISPENMGKIMSNPARFNQIAEIFENNKNWVRNPNHIDFLLSCSDEEFNSAKSQMLQTAEDIKAGKKSLENWNDELNYFQNPIKNREPNIDNQEPINKKKEYTDEEIDNLIKDHEIEEVKLFRNLAKNSPESIEEFLAIKNKEAAYDLLERLSPEELSRGDFIELFKQQNRLQELAVEVHSDFGNNTRILTKIKTFSDDELKEFGKIYKEGGDAQVAVKYLHKLGILTDENITIFQNRKISDVQMHELLDVKCNFSSEDLLQILSSNNKGMLKIVSAKNKGRELSVLEICSIAGIGDTEKRNRLLKIHKYLPDVVYKVITSDFPEENMKKLLETLGRYSEQDFIKYGQDILTKPFDNGVYSKKDLKTISNLYYFEPDLYEFLKAKPGMFGDVIKKLENAPQDKLQTALEKHCPEIYEDFNNFMEADISVQDITIDGRGNRKLKTIEERVRVYELSKSGHKFTVEELNKILDAPEHEWKRLQELYQNGPKNYKLTLNEDIRMGQNIKTVQISTDANTVINFETPEMQQLLNEMKEGEYITFGATAILPNAKKHIKINDGKNPPSSICMTIKKENGELIIQNVSGCDMTLNPVKNESAVNIPSNKRFNNQSAPEIHLSEVDELVHSSLLSSPVYSQLSEIEVSCIMASDDIKNALVKEIRAGKEITAELLNDVSTKVIIKQIQEGKTKFSISDKKIVETILSSSNAKDFTPTELLTILNNDKYRGIALSKIRDGQPITKDLFQPYSIYFTDGRQINININDNFTTSQLLGIANREIHKSSTIAARQQIRGFEQIDDATISTYYKNPKKYQAEINKQIPAGEIRKSTDGTLYYNSGNELIKIEMDEETFRDLFPTSMMNEMAQGSIGDCWLVSAFGALMDSPVGRGQIFKLFKQEGDIISVKLPGMKEAIQFKREIATSTKLIKVERDIYTEQEIPKEIKLAPRECDITLSDGKTHHFKGPKLINENKSITRFYTYTPINLKNIKVINLENLSISGNNLYNNKKTLSGSIGIKMLELVAAERRSDRLYKGRRTSEYSMEEILASYDNEAVKKILHGGQQGDAINLICGDKKNRLIHDVNLKDKNIDEQLRVIEEHLENNPNAIIVFATKGLDDSLYFSKELDLVKQHAYRVVGINRNKGTITISNPHHNNTTIEIPIKIWLKYINYCKIIDIT